MKVCSICQLSHDDSMSCAKSNSAPDIKGYQIETLLTDTSSGETYRARETTSGRNCLITLVTSDEKTAEKFLAETNIAAGLFHPGVADVYDAGRLDDGRCFVVSEDLDGRTLRDVIDNAGSPELLNTVEIVRQVAEALNALHAKGLTHRAINPHNIVLSTNSDGVFARIRNVDFGAARSHAIVADKFQLDSRLASLRYFAPEQFDDAEASRQTDLYSLGVVFYEMLSGAPPFQAAKAGGLIDQHRNAEPQVISINSFELRALITHALNESLHKRPEARQASADLFARQLRHIEQLATHSSVPPPAMRSSLSPRPATTIAPVPASEPANPTHPEPVKKSRFIDTSGVSIEDWELKRTRVVADDDVPVEETVATDLELQPVNQSADASTITPLPRRRSRLDDFRTKLRAVSERVAAETRRLGTEASARLDALRQAKQKMEAPEGRTLMPRKIEWVQPEDDIPTIADVQTALEKEPVVSASRIRNVEAPPVTPPADEQEISLVLTAPAHVEEIVEDKTEPQIELATPDPAPVVEQARPASRLVIRKKAKRKIVKTEPAPVVPSPSISAAPVPKVQPKLQKIQTVTNIEPISPAIMAAIRAAAKANTVEVVSTRAAAVFDPSDLEEITLVRAPRSRVRIDIDRATRRPRPQPINFTPTIIGNRRRAAERDSVPPDAIFATSYNASGRASAGLPYKSIATGLGLIAVLAFFLFGVSLVREFSESAGPADSGVTQASVKKEKSAAAAPVSSSARSDATSRSIVPVKVVAVDPKPEVGKGEPPAVKNRTKDSSRPKPKTRVEKDAARSAPKAATEKKVTEKKTPPTTKPAPGTRPRIVKDPRS